MVDSALRIVHGLDVKPCTALAPNGIADNQFEVYCTTHGTNDSLGFFRSLANNLVSLQHTVLVGYTVRNNGVLLHVNNHVVEVEVADSTQVLNQITLSATGLHHILVVGDNLLLRNIGITDNSQHDVIIVIVRFFRILGV